VYAACADIGVTFYLGGKAKIMNVEDLMTLRDIKSKTYVEDTEDQNGAPIERIGTWKPGQDSDAAWFSSPQINPRWDKDAKKRGYVLQAGQPAQLLILGRNLWRNPKIFIGSQGTSSGYDYTILPDMQGLVARFTNVQTVATAPGADASPSPSADPGTATIQPASGSAVYIGHHYHTVEGLVVRGAGTGLQMGPYKQTSGSVTGLIVRHNEVTGNGIGIKFTNVVSATAAHNVVWNNGKDGIAHIWGPDTSAMPQWAIAHAGSFSAMAVNAFTVSGKKKECAMATARLNCVCAAGLQEIGKLTSPNRSSFARTTV
jgi:hypothetical protein